MSFENAKANLQEFGKELGLEGLEFDENNTCILGIDDEFSLHITYEPNSKRLYLYSPLLDGLPDDDKIKLRLYERLLEGTILGGQVAGGGIGVATKEGLILLHCTVPMEHAEANALRQFAPLYVETVEKWRKICEDLKEGREPSVEPPGPPIPGKEITGGGAVKKSSPKQEGGGGRPGGEGYIKI